MRFAAYWQRSVTRYTGFAESDSGPSRSRALSPENGGPYGLKRSWRCARQFDRRPPPPLATDQRDKIDTP